MLAVEAAAGRATERSPSMLTRVRFALGVVFLLALVVVFVVQPEFWPRNWLWADVEPILDADGEVIAPAQPGPTICDQFPEFCRPVQGIFEDGGGGGGEILLLRNPLVTKFFPADFHPTADSQTGEFRRYGVLLTRGDATVAGVVMAVVAKVNPSDPKIVHLAVFGEIPVPTNNFFAGKAEAVLAVSDLDPSGNGNGSLAFVVSGSSDNFPLGRITVVRNAWGAEQEVALIPGLTGPVSVGIDDEAGEVIVVEQTEDGEGNQECDVGESPVRFFSLADASSTSPYGEVRRLCIDGVGDSADIEVDADNRLAFIARSFSEGGVCVIDLSNPSEDCELAAALNLYSAGASAPAPGLDLDLDAGIGYLAAPQLDGVKRFSLATGSEITPAISADVYYPVQSSVPTGLKEVSVSNFPNGQNNVRRGIVISRSDPTNYPNRADQVTRINLVTGNTNRLDTDKQTTTMAFVRQRSTDQSNQEFFLRVKVKSSDQSVAMKLKKYDYGTVP